MLVVVFISAYKVIHYFRKRLHLKQFFLLLVCKKHYKAALFALRMERNHPRIAPTADDVCRLRASTQQFCESVSPSVMMFLSVAGSVDVVVRTVVMFAAMTLSEIIRHGKA